MDKKKLYITTPIFYTNGDPHLGHLHTCFLGDFFKKTFSYFNYDVFFLTGTDEHGQKIQNTAKKLNITPQELVDKTTNTFKELWKEYSIDYDYFIRTTDINHKKNIHDVWNKLVENKYIYEGKYEGLYGEKDECFYSLEETYLDANQQRRAIISNNEVEITEENCYFFKLSEFKEKLLIFYKEYSFTLPLNKKEEFIKYVENLKDLCISRKISWGIDIPNNKIPNNIIYVWIDALFNYMTGIGGINNYDKDLWANSLQIVGKDISIFHGVFWPALLMALDISPPKTLLIHEWWLFNDSKMSKSIGNIINPKEIKNKEYLRYYCLKQELLGQDGNFTKSHFISIINNELIGKILNLFYRVLSLIKKNYGFNKQIILQYYEKREDILNYKKVLLKIIEGFSSKHYINYIVEISSNLNEYIEKNKIWKNFNEDHINYLIPILDLIKNALNGLLVETIYKLNSFYSIDNNFFVLNDLTPLFNPLNEEESL
jgi:methionyl-tRNA synthetase